MGIVFHCSKDSCSSVPMSPVCVCLSMDFPGGQPVAGLRSLLLLLAAGPLALWGEPPARIWPLFSLSHICLVFLKQTEKLSCFFGAAEPNTVPRCVPCLAPTAMAWLCLGAVLAKGLHLVCQEGEMLGRRKQSISYSILPSIKY